MKKILLFLFFLSFTNVLLGQWDLFPYNQTSHFFKETAPDEYEIFSYKVDSIEVTPEGEWHRFFTEKLPYDEVDSTCFSLDPLLEEHLFVYSSSLTFPIYKYEMRSDSVFYYLNDPDDPRQFVFLPKVEVGTTWQATDTVQITCSKIEEDSFLGITDSVKTFIIESDVLDYNGLEILLSKNYGLISFPNISFLTKWDNYRFPFFQLELRGIVKDSIITGFKKPNLYEFFDPVTLEPGNILYFRGSSGDFQGTNSTWTRFDTITEVGLSFDSFYFKYNGVRYQNYLGDQGIESDTFFYEDRKTIYDLVYMNKWLEKSSSFPGFHYASVYDYRYLYNPNEKNKYEIQQLFDMSFYSESNCELNPVYDATNAESLWPLCGFKGRWSIFSESGFEGLWTPDGICGNFPVNTFTPKATSELTLFPNPTTSELQVNQSGKYMIYDSVGRVVQEGATSDGALELQFSGAGIFFIKLESGGKVYAGRFLKY